MSSFYDNPDALANAERHRAAQKRRDEKDARRRGKINKSRQAGGKKPRDKRPRLAEDRDEFGRPIYRPGMGRQFYKTSAWVNLRYKILQQRGAKCDCCGATRDDGVKIHVDHIRPRSRFPLLELVEDNMQVLCEPCNLGKGAWDMTDWRVGGGITHPRMKAIKAAHG